MKKIITLFLVSLLALAMIGCSTKSGVAVGEISSSGSKFISEKYKLSNQSFTKSFSLKDGETATVVIDVVTDSGDIKIDIVEDKSDSIYSKEKIITQKEEIIVDKSGKYKINIITKDHSGGFNISWNINK